MPRRARAPAWPSIDARARPPRPRRRRSRRGAPTRPSGGRARHWRRARLPWRSSAAEPRSLRRFDITAFVGIRGGTLERGWLFPVFGGVGPGRIRSGRAFPGRPRSMDRRRDEPRLGSCRGGLLGRGRRPTARCVERAGRACEHAPRRSGLHAVGTRATRADDQRGRPARASGGSLRRADERGV